MGFRVSIFFLSFCFRVQVSGLGFRAEGLWYRSPPNCASGPVAESKSYTTFVQGAGVRVQGSGFRVQGAGCRVESGWHRDERVPKGDGDGIDMCIR